MRRKAATSMLSVVEDTPKLDGTAASFRAWIKGQTGQAVTAAFEQVLLEWAQRRMAGNDMSFNDVAVFKLLAPHVLGNPDAQADKGTNNYMTLIVHTEQAATETESREAIRKVLNEAKEAKETNS